MFRLYIPFIEKKIYVSILSMLKNNMFWLRKGKCLHGCYHITESATT
jgi:hypothetical protein